MAITKSQVTLMQNELAAVAEKYGMVVKNRASYNSQTVNFSIGVTILDESINHGGSNQLTANNVRAGMAPIGSKVLIKGDVYTVLSKRRTKYVIQNSVGQQYTAAFTICTPA